jgi:hypothetical protein
MYKKTLEPLCLTPLEMAVPFRAEHNGSSHATVTLIAVSLPYLIIRTNNKQILKAIHLPNLQELSK